MYLQYVANYIFDTDGSVSVPVECGGSVRIGAEAARLGLGVAVEAGVAGHVVDWGRWISGADYLGRRTHVTRKACEIQIHTIPPDQMRKTWRSAAVSGA